MLSSLSLLNQLRQESNRQTEVTRAAKVPFLETAAITHLQCTPSMAKLLASNEETQRSLRKNSKPVPRRRTTSPIGRGTDAENNVGANLQHVRPNENDRHTMQELSAEEDRISIGSRIRQQPGLRAGQARWVSSGRSQRRALHRRRTGCARLP